MKVECLGFGVSLFGSGAFRSFGLKSLCLGLVALGSGLSLGAQGYGSQVSLRATWDPHILEKLQRRAAGVAQAAGTELSTAEPWGFRFVDDMDNQ